LFVQPATKTHRTAPAKNLRMKASLIGCNKQLKIPRHKTEFRLWMQAIVASKEHNDARVCKMITV
ncbi:MAG: hypothetical protein KGN33_12615, partial [Paracoccaceae bacterium]|nr:hypothetical protein [Paracoccaceae bacterium]